MYILCSVPIFFMVTCFYEHLKRYIWDYCKVKITIKLTNNFPYLGFWYEMYSKAMEYFPTWNVLKDRHNQITMPSVYLHLYGSWLMIFLVSWQEISWPAKRLSVTEEELCYMELEITTCDSRYVCWCSKIWLGLWRGLQSLPELVL
jgi:hypothetical protein